MQALEVAAAIGNKRGEANALGNLGLAYQGLGNIKQSIRCLQAALTIACEIGDRRSEEIREGNLGIAFRISGETEQAIRHFQKALDIARSIGDKYNEAIWLGNLGMSYHLQGRLEDALFMLENAVARQPLRGAWHCSLAAVMSDLGKHKEAEKHLQNAYKLVPTYDYYNRACLEAIAGNLDSALEYLAEAVKQKPGLRNLARFDIDLVSLRSNPRFVDLVTNPENTD